MLSLAVFLAEELAYHHQSVDGTYGPKETPGGNMDRSVEWAENVRTGDIPYCEGATATRASERENSAGS